MITEKEFCKAIEYICQRPYRFMWLRTGSFNEILAYIQGFSYGAEVESEGHSYTSSFHHWLAVKFSSKNNLFGWNEYRQIFPDEEEAIVNLPILYREFAERFD